MRKTVMGEDCCGQRRWSALYQGGSQKICNREIKARSLVDGQCYTVAARI
ncbi:hypothetical protein SAMN02787142_6948 [Burkholderia sp. WP9]|nr:hypothetical protein SAMN02787142_6948 [Burkholderia sp. WP9]